MKASLLEEKLALLYQIRPFLYLIYATYITYMENVCTYLTNLTPAQQV